MSPLAVLLITVALVALSAFFVAVEFSLMAARRHRLEDQALHSRAARAALRSCAELTVLLAGCQLGITVCTLALGAVTKPAVHHALVPLLGTLGLPVAAVDVLAFVLALLVVTFVHLVVGEMAPKSWAIAHPERSAVLLALPMRAFMVVLRPLLVVLNDTATALVRRAGADPDAPAAGGRSPAELRHLVEHSVDAGVLDAPHAARLTAALEIGDAAIDGLVHRAPPVAVGVGATAAEVRAASLDSGHLRVLVRDRAGELTGLVHVRDTLSLADREPVADVTRPVLRLPAELSIRDTLARMRRTSTHLALVHRGGEVLGVVTLADVLGFVTPTHLPRG
ncbi:CNNM domain-containing protein [Arsenicicoccus dermatophilus]|uniref:CNNM domain-containing protein n=1 Tax=Arsenicicoccus dermatophilus TaxID=1076331 RepID=UPI0039170EE5